MRERHETLVLHRAALDIDGVLQALGFDQGLPDLGKMATQLHDDRGLVLPESSDQLRQLQGRRQHTQHFVTLRDRQAGRGPATGHAGHARNDLGREAMRQSHMHVQVGAEEQRIAFREHGDHTSRLQMSGNRLRGVIEEGLDHRAVLRVAHGPLRRDRIQQGQLGCRWAQKWRGSASRIALISGLGKVRHDLRALQRTHCLQCQKLRIAGADTHSDEAACRAHGSDLAKALSAAAAIALPPSRPRIVRKGTRSGCVSNCSFDSAAPTNPTGRPRMAAGLGAPAPSISSSRNRAVGALPMATTAPASRSSQRSSAAADRVVPSFSAISGTRPSRKVHTTRLSAGRRARVIPCATISESHMMGAPAASAARAAVTSSGANTICSATSTRPHAWTMRTTTSDSLREKREREASARMISKERS